jgi:ribonucleoside-diphosphate reductase beta chain
VSTYQASDVEDVDGDLDGGHEPSPFVKLFNRWEQQPWQSLSIDLATDRSTWQRLPSALRTELQVTICEFGGGDVAVTRLLLPLIAHAPHDSWRLYLTTQLSDEARHAVFFARYYDEVVRGQVTASSGSATAYQEFDNSAYETEFTPLLARAVAAAGESAASWHYASTLYHLITEGVLGVAILRIARTLGRSPRMLPGLAEGVAGVFRDESRHITFGRRAAMAGLAAGVGDAIAEAYVTGTRAAARVMIGPSRAEAPLAGPAAVQRAQQRRVRLADACERAIRQAQVLGLPVARQALQDAWDDACGRAVGDYAIRWGHEHPLAHALGVAPVAQLAEMALPQGAVAGDA